MWIGFGYKKEKKIVPVVNNDYYGYFLTLKWLGGARTCMPNG